MKEYVTYDEGSNVMHELISTQTMITSLINTNDNQSQTDAMKDLKTHIDKYDQIVLEFENHDKNKPVS